MTDERRTFDRVQLRVPGRLGLDDGQQLSVQLVDLSEGGVRLHLPEPLAVGSTAMLEVELPPYGAPLRAPISVVAVLPSADGLAAACQFGQLTTRDLWNIVRSCLALTGAEREADRLSNVSPWPVGPNRR